MTSTKTLTARQAQALAAFSAGRKAGFEAEGVLVMRSTGTMTQAEAKALITKGLIHAEFRTLQFGVKEWTLTEAGAEAFSRLRIAKGRTFQIEAS